MPVQAYAVVDGSGAVVNVVSWDGVTQWSPPKGTTAVLSDGNKCQIGGTYVDGVFSEPAATILPKDESVAAAEIERQNLLNVVASSIAVWQTKLLMGRTLTAAETTSLNAWLDYSDEVSAVDTSTAPDITWPTMPDDTATVTVSTQATTGTAS